MCSNTYYVNLPTKGKYFSPLLLRALLPLFLFASLFVLGEQGSGHLNLFILSPTAVILFLVIPT